MSILILADFPSLNEAGGAFTNGYWKYFRAQLRRAGISPEDCTFMNVLSHKIILQATTSIFLSSVSFETG